ncbi:MAG: FAD-dependent monooxygenase [Ruminococcus sp.]|nr:FAD-dependent monooxygenase [Ruminococcus sp.]
MIKLSNLSVPLRDAEKSLKEISAKKLRIKPGDITEVRILRKSIDARKKQDIRLVMTLAVSVKNETAVLKKCAKQLNISVYEPYCYTIPTVTSGRERPVVVGFGPAGMFAGFLLAKAGLRPVILERGACVTDRQKAVESFRSTGKLDTESNVQFGEGGAGTFSDGKLTTGISDPRIQYVLETFVEHGAPEDILYAAKPHIGTDCLVNVVQNIRRSIQDMGGEVRFHAKFCGYETDTEGKLANVSYQQNGVMHTISTRNCILATGHSARDVFRMLQKENVTLTRKNFAMGVRIEHLQADLNRCMYGEYAGHPALGAADYKMAVHLPNGHSMYTFCMCPGGEVIASSSEAERLVVNGMSYRSRNGANANSAILVGVSPEMLDGTDPLAGMLLQEELEHKAFLAGGRNYTAPVCLVGDFLEKRASAAFGKIKPTYRPGTKFVLPDTYLPAFMTETLRLGIPAMGRKLSLFHDPEAILTGVESRSSSPVRIVRNEQYQSVSVAGLYPCGEGAGYAGGITSAAVDGLRCAEALIATLS